MGHIRPYQVKFLSFLISVIASLNKYLHQVADNVAQLIYRCEQRSLSLGS
ncbi:hypothetical protein HKBW3S42_00401 [Candidatus Hakubella thermalkaliphila]|uniref:Uncharacterized protein n=1 Tax=Candidatus Hakubella thermalkaliphila TaxID=2754717 RepID=A0A6V8P913_9ACTN|nr:hypothetical protein HKBW3S33_00719 [Candidatus Hakubella thermalkaliphila]GFP32096.1 hypothetical protein HKBW3S42_00401 [Candidatus Hakubella thermalkaliphila]